MKDPPEEIIMPAGSERTRIVGQEAAYWYIRCTDERQMLSSDRRLFFAWVKRSPENIAELLRMCRMDSKFAKQRLLDRLSELDESNIVDVDFGVGPSQYEYEPSDTVEDVPPQKVPPVKAPPARPFWMFAATAAGFAVAIMLGVVLLTRTPEGTVETRASQWQHMTLEDGSTVHIDARSRLRVEFTAERRVLHLYEGQAVFDVEKDARRPFVVQTNLADVVAVGTRFGVAITTGVTTTVEEGVVKVIPHGQPGAQPVMVRQNEELIVSEPRLLQNQPLRLPELTPVKVDAKRKLLWTTGWIDMEGSTIREVVAEFNRRHVIQAQIDSPEVADHRLSHLRFKIDSVEGFSNVMENEEGVAVTMDADNKTLHLRSE